MAGELIEKAKSKGIELVLPLDVVVADKFINDANTQIVDASEIPDGWTGLDIGPKSIELFTSIIKSAQTIVWNGPMGVFELENFAKGTYAIAESLANATQNNGAVTVVGGGDSAAAINQMKFDNKVTHVSTGGGASLEFLEGKILPGVQALEV